jgi:hypothetical protein
MNEHEADDLLNQAAANALIYGCGFIKVAHTNGSFELSVVPIEEYKYLRIDERGLLDFVEVKE